MINIGFWGPFYYNYNKEPKNIIDNYVFRPPFYARNPDPRVQGILRVLRNLLQRALVFFPAEIRCAANPNVGT